MYKKTLFFTLLLLCSLNIFAISDSIEIAKITKIEDYIITHKTDSAQRLLAQLDSNTITKHSIFINILQKVAHPTQVTKTSLGQFISQLNTLFIRI